MKKNFKDYDTTPPEMDFIKSSVEKAEKLEKAPAPAKTFKGETVPDGMKPNPLFVEKRTKRVQLVMQPSIYEQAKARAKSQGMSFNDYMHTLIEKDLNG